jgi:hypothetical protein
MDEVINLLIDIKNNTSGSLEPFWIALITGGAGLLGVISGGALTYSSNNNKIRADIVTKERQVWIKEFRGKVAELFQQYEELLGLLDSAENSNEPVGLDRIDSHIKVVRFNHGYLRLMLDSSIEDHAKAREGLDAMMRILSDASDPIRPNPMVEYQNRYRSTKTKLLYVFDKVLSMERLKVQQIQ